MKISFLAGGHMVMALSLAAGGALAGPPDFDNGRDINGTCAACHGDLGEGGKHGEYPRLAGMASKYIAMQLRAFRDRSRINIPMFPFTQERELSDRDIEDIAAYLGAIDLPTQMPEFKPTDDALTRLTAAMRVMQIPRSEGDIAKGGSLYDKACGSCHSKDGGGKGTYPALRGQYTRYLDRQIKEFIRGSRLHEQEEPGPGLLSKFSEADLRDILAYISTLDD
jgi:cytochrome c553